MNASRLVVRGFIEVAARTHARRWEPDVRPSGRARILWREGDCGRAKARGKRRMRTRRRRWVFRASLRVLNCQNARRTTEERRFCATSERPAGRSLLAQKGEASHPLDARPGSRRDPEGAVEQRPRGRPLSWPPHPSRRVSDRRGPGQKRPEANAFGLDGMRVHPRGGKGRVSRSHPRGAGGVTRANQTWVTRNSKIVHDARQ